MDEPDEYMRRWLAGLESTLDEDTKRWLKDLGEETLRRMARHRQLLMAGVPETDPERRRLEALLDERFAPYHPPSPEEQTRVLLMLGRLRRQP